MGDKLPRSVVVVTVDRVYFQCQKALARSRLWDPEAQAARDEVPTAGDFMVEITDGEFDGVEYDRNYPDHMKKTIY